MEHGITPPLLGSGSDPIGVILAGGRGRRIGGSKAMVELCGRPLISYPLAALRAALDEVVVIAKPNTELPVVSNVSIWIEPELPRHPLVGIVQALGLAGGRAVLVCAADMPFVTPGLVSRIAEVDPGEAPAVVPSCDGEIEPLLALYLPAAFDVLSEAVRDARAPLRQIVEAIHPRLVQVDNREEFFNINAPEDLLQAAGLLDRAAATERATRR